MGAPWTLIARCVAAPVCCWTAGRSFGEGSGGSLLRQFPRHGKEPPRGCRGAADGRADPPRHLLCPPCCSLPFLPYQPRRLSGYIFDTPPFAPCPPCCSFTSLPCLLFLLAPRRLSGYIFDEKVAIARTYLEPQVGFPSCSTFVVSWPQEGSSSRVAAHQIARWPSLPRPCLPTQPTRRRVPMPACLRVR